MSALETCATNYLFDGANLIEELDNAGNVLARYAQGPVADEPLTELRSGTASYYEADGLGSITSLSNGAGTLANTYTYNSYGKLTASTGTITNPFQFTAREFDSETGIYEYRARYYDQNIGRFVSEDQIGFKGGVDFYAYVGNGPTDWIDPFGFDKKRKDCVWVCSRPTQFNGKWEWVNYTGLSHSWIRTDTVEAGLGPATGNVPGAGAPDAIGSPTAIVNHAGESSKPGSSCFQTCDVNVDAVNKQLQIGTPEGPFFPGLNDCHLFVSRVLQNASTARSTGPWWDAP